MCRFKEDQYVRTISATGSHPECFGLVLISAWPPTALEDPYRRLTSDIREIHPSFASEFAYVYPFEHLHVTIATCAPFTLQLPAEQHDAYIKAWSEVINEASRQPSWPKAEFTLRVREVAPCEELSLLLLR